LIADIAKDYKPRGASGVIEYYYHLCQSLNFDKGEEIKILMMSDFCKVFTVYRYVLNVCVMLNRVRDSGSFLRRFEEKRA
jgi:hypothetical protein